MGATKINHYSTENIQLAQLANALGHPARITIIKTLKENPYLRNVDFMSVLNLSSTTVHDHLVKLKSANIVEFQYFHHEYRINLVPEILDEINFFLRD